jgi:hypothetical protein
MDGETISIDELASTAFNQMYEALVQAPSKGTDEDRDTYAKEQATLVEGLIRGYHKHVWPKLLVKYPTIVGVEQEATYVMADGIEFIARPDLLMADAQGGIHYIEFKSTSSKKPEWVNSWDTAVQLHSSVKAVEATTGILPEDVTIVGFYKGYVSYGRQNSPFAYGYKRSGNPPFTQDQIQYDYKAGFKKFEVWSMEGGCKAWIDSMPESVLADQFPMTAPIYINEDLINGFFDQRTRREQDIQYAVESMDTVEPKDVLLAKYFPQRFDACAPAWGYGCEFKKLCFGFVQDPTSEGFTLRIPHMEAERKALNIGDDGSDEVGDLQV